MKESSASAKSRSRLSPVPWPRSCAIAPAGSLSKRAARPRRWRNCSVAALGWPLVSTLRVTARWISFGPESETPIGVAQAPARSRTPISGRSARALLDRISTPRQARRVGLLVVAVGRLLLGLCLLGGCGCIAVVPVLSYRAPGAADGGAHRGALTGIAAGGAPDHCPDGGAARRASHRATLLRGRRRGRLGRCTRVEARLLLGPVVTRVLITLERLLALPRLGVDEDLGLRRAHEYARGESGNDRGGPSVHVRPP